MSPVEAFGAAARRVLPAWSPPPERPGLRVVPGSPRRAPRAPFVALVLTILGIGMVGLLMLNTALQQGSFELGDLRTEVGELRDRESALSRQVAERANPGALARRANQLGMVPVEDPQFLRLDGSAAGASQRADR